MPSAGQLYDRYMTVIRPLYDRYMNALGRPRECASHLGVGERGAQLGLGRVAPRDGSVARQDLGASRRTVTVVCSASVASRLEMAVWHVRIWALHGEP